jgi:NAD(P)-dependent dehydrogenase (short-subunit alcohol dehydrogenase family)
VTQMHAQEHAEEHAENEAPDARRGRLAGRVGLLTGTASGIGRAGAEAFARAGAAIVAMDIDPAGEKAVAGITQAGGRAVFHHGDASKPGDVSAAVALAVETFGHLDLVWANAGVNVFKNIVDTTEDEWDRVIDVNLKGCFLAAKYSIPELIRAGGGTIVFTGSVNSFVGDPGAPVYCASKGGILMLARAIALEYADQRIRVNCLCPGSTDTPFQEAALRAISDSEAEYAELVRQEEAAIPLGRYATSAEVAKAAVFLSSDDSSFVTGSALMVDGGYTTK